MGKEWLELPVCKTVELTGRPYSLTPEGKRALRELFRKVVKGEEAWPSNQTRVLDGYTLAPPEGVGQLKANLRDQNFAFVVNHLGRCPAGAVGLAIYTNLCIKQVCGREPRLVLGAGRTIVSAIRKEISQSTKFILTEGGVREILEEIDKGECVGIYPEGGNSCSLNKGSFKTGRFLLHVAERGVPIVCLGIVFKDKTFSGRLSLPVDLDKIRQLGHSSEDKREAGQRVVDYVMVELARLLPEHLRGHYRELTAVSDSGSVATGQAQASR